MDSRTGRKLIDVGIDRNLLVYDISAERGYLTKKLVYHVKQHAPKVTHILIPKSVFIEFLPDDWIQWNNVPHFISLMVLCFGTEISFDERLDNADIFHGHSHSDDYNKCGPWFRYYMERGASLANDDDFLILAYNNNLFSREMWKIEPEDVILGSC